MPGPDGLDAVRSRLKPEARARRISFGDLSHQCGNIAPNDRIPALRGGDLESLSPDRDQCSGESRLAGIRLGCPVSLAWRAPRRLDRYLTASAPPCRHPPVLLDASADWMGSPSLLGFTRLRSQRASGAERAVRKRKCAKACDGRAPPRRAPTGHLARVSPADIADVLAPRGQADSRCLSVDRRAVLRADAKRRS